MLVVFKVYSHLSFHRPVSWLTGRHLGRNFVLFKDHCIVLIYNFLFTVAIVSGQSSGDVGTSTCMVVRSQSARCSIGANEGGGGGGGGNKGEV